MTLDFSYSDQNSTFTVDPVAFGNLSLVADNMHAVN